MGENTIGTGVIACAPYVARTLRQELDDQMTTCRAHAVKLQEARERAEKLGILDTLVDDLRGILYPGMPF